MGCHARQLQRNTTTIDKLFIAGVFDTNNFDWGEELFNFTVSLINDQEDGWHDDIWEEDGETIFDWKVANAACDETKAALRCTGPNDNRARDWAARVRAQC